MECDQIIFSVHATRRLFQRRIRPRSVRDVVRASQPFLRYPSAKPYPKFLVLGYADGQAIHVVVARNEDDKGCVVVTVYFPDPDQWAPDLLSRRSK
jgi:hypothetical protein